MKYIKLINISQNCDSITSHLLVFSCDKLLRNESFTYPVTSTKEEIVMLIDSSYVDYSISFDWVGGRPNDRK